MSVRQILTQEGKLIQESIPDNIDVETINGIDIDALKLQVDDNTTEITATQGDLAVLQGDVAVLETDVGNLQTDVTNLQTDVNDLQIDVNNLQVDVSTLNSDVFTLNTNVSTLQGEMVTVQTDISTLNGEVYNNNGVEQLVRTNNIGQIDSSLISISQPDFEVYPTVANFPPVGDTTKYYVAADQPNVVYRWSGVSYVVTTTPVYSVNGEVAVVVLTTDDISDTTDVNKYVTAAEKAQITTNQTNITTLQGEMVTAQTDISDLQTDVLNLDTDLTTAEANITTLQGEMTAVQADISNLEAGNINNVSISDNVSGLEILGNSTNQLLQVKNKIVLDSDNTGLPITLDIGAGGTLQNVSYTASASDLTTGTISDARLPTAIANKTITSSSVNGVTLAGSGTLNIGSGGALVASAFTNTTNASNISSGTLNDARLPTSMSGKNLIGNSTINDISLSPLADGFNILGGVNSKSFNVINTITLSSSSDNKALNIAGGGTLQPIAYSGSGSDISSGTVADARIASVLTSKTYNGVTPSSQAIGFKISGGTTSKSLDVNNSIVLSGTDNSTLNISTGGTLQPIAYSGSGSDISTGTVADARIASVLTSKSVNGVTLAGSGSLNIGSGGTLVASAFTDTTNASNISSGTLANARIASALTGKTYDGLTLSSELVGFKISGGTTSKSLDINNNIIISGVDDSTLNISTGGTLQPIAYSGSGSDISTGTVASARIATTLSSKVLTDADVTLGANLKSTTDTLQIRPQSSGNVYTYLGLPSSGEHWLVGKTSNGFGTRTGMILSTTQNSKSYAQYVDTSETLILEVADVDALTYNNATPATQIWSISSTGNLTLSSGNIRLSAISSTIPTTYQNAFINTSNKEVVTFPTFGRSVVTATDTTTSTTYVGLANAMTFSLTTGTRVKVTLTATLQSGTNNTPCYMSFAISGATTLASSDANALIINAQGNVPFRASAVTYLDTLTAGSNTFTAQFRTTAGTLTALNRLLLVEII